MSDEVEEESLASLFARYMQNPCLPALAQAQKGIREPLAKYIEEGGEVGPETRAWLAKFLRGEVKFRQGSKRRHEKIMDDARLLIAVECLQAEYGLTENGAKNKYLEENEDLNDETIKTALRRAKRDPEVWAMAFEIRRSAD